MALESNEHDVKIGENLRRRWVTDQAADPELHEDIQRLRKNKGVGEEYKRLKDGLLEVCVKGSYPGEHVIWVPVVPNGNIRGESWKTWLIQMFHEGVQGGHRSAEKTLTLLRREGYWKTMKQDVESYVDRCKTLSLIHI